MQLIYHEYVCKPIKIDKMSEAFKEALKVPFKIGPENLSSNHAAPLCQFFNFDNCFALGDLTKVQVKVPAGRSVKAKVKQELHLTGPCRIMSLHPDINGNQHVSVLDATIHEGTAHIDERNPATVMSITIAPDGSILDLSIGNPSQFYRTAHGDAAYGSGFIAKFESKPFQGRPTLDKGFAQADIDRLREIDSLLETLKRADAQLRDAKKRLESASTSLAAFDKMSPEQRSAKELVIAQKQKTVSDAQSDIAQIEKDRRDNAALRLDAERMAILSKAPQIVACTMFERGKIIWSRKGMPWVSPMIDRHQHHFVVDDTHERTVTRYGKHVDTDVKEFDRLLTYGHNLFVRRDFPGQQIKTDVTMDRSAPSHERPTEAMHKEATRFMPLLAHAEEVFKRDDVPFLEMIAHHRIPADCTPQQLSRHLTFIDARWKTLAMRPLPPAHHPPSGSSLWKAESPSSSDLVKNLAKRQLWDKLLQLPDTDAGRQRPISSCASTGQFAVRCSPMHHAPACRHPMFCPANRAVSSTFTYPTPTTNLHDQVELRELLCASSSVEEAVPASRKRSSAQASAAQASAAQASSSSADPKSSKRSKKGGIRTRRRLRV